MQSVDPLERDVCLEVAHRLEAISRHKLQNTEIERAIADFMYRSRFRDAEALNALVERLLAYQAGNKDTDGKQPPIPLTPEALLTSDFLADKIAPLVRMIRERLFGTSETPFRSMNEAIQWIEHEGQRGLDEKTVEEASQLTERLMKITHYKVSRKYLPYPGEDGWVRVVPIWPRTSLELLADETRRIAEGTGFSQVSVIMYILADIKPLLVRIRRTRHPALYHLPTGETLTSTHIALDIWAKDLSFEDLRQIYKGVRKELGVVKGRGFKQEHLELYQIVQRKGGAPKPREKGTVAFWESVKDESNEKSMGGKYGSW